MAGLFRLLARLWRILTYPVLALGHLHHVRPSEEETAGRLRSQLCRLAIGLFRRILLAPVLLAVIMAMLLFGTTHRVGTLAPKPPQWSPASVNLFYRDVRFRSDDGVDLAGWYVPAWSAGRFAQENDSMLRQRRPGLVLCHGAWADRSQLLHLLPALHGAGYELLLVEMRGCGESGGQTGLGLSEWQDAVAAIRWMQQVGPVDPQRMGLIGCDVNSATVLRVARDNPAVLAVIIDRPCRNVGTYLNKRFEHIRLPGPIFGRLYEWSFALTRTADMNDASAQRWASQLPGDRSLLIAARKHDPLAPANDPYAVLSAAQCNKTIKVCAATADEPGQSALLPNDVVAFLQARLPIVPPSPPVVTLFDDDE